MAKLNLIHRAHLPAGTAPFPAVVMIHGWLGNEHVMTIFERTVPEGVAILSPRGPLADDGGFGWFADRASASDFAHGLESLYEFVRRLPEAYPLDPARIYLMGFSQGAAMGYGLALKEPKLVAGLAALAGFLPPPASGWTEPGRLAGKPVFIAHGTQDERVPVAEARRARDGMASAGAEVTYREYPTGHKMNAQGMRDLKHWLAAVYNV
jgi:phospholipase/carboxylesterase